MQVYLDNSATTKPCKAAVEAVNNSMESVYFNPSALYSPAIAAEKELTSARQVIAKSVHANEKNVIFTSGGTEGDNLAVWGRMQGMHPMGEVLYTAAEHSAVKQACLEAQKRFGCAAREIPLTGDGSVDLEALRDMMNEKTQLICVMQVCNETGVIMPIREICQMRDELCPDCAIHVDGVQGYLRVPFSFREYGVQSYALSGHKIHATKGVGALILREGYQIKPQFAGGGQQNGIRSGTENTVGIAGLKAAVEDYPKNGYDLMKKLKAMLADRLLSALPDAKIMGLPVDDPMSACHILNISFQPVRAETLLHALEAEGVLVGTGSACSSKKGKHSPVLTAMKATSAEMESAIRISLCPYNTEEEIAFACDQIIEKVGMLRRFTRR